jgi:hypothetical protein
MWFRRLIGGLLGLLLLVLGGFLGIVELTGDEPTRWWLPVFAVVPGAMFLAATWLTWALPGSSGAKD